MPQALERRPRAKKLDRTFPASVVRELETLEKDAGGRGVLVGLLTLAPLNDDLRYVLGLLGDPQNSRLTLATICERGNILPGELLKHLGAAALLRGQTLAMQAVGSGLAAVARDVMKHAAPYEEPCEACEGTGSLTPDPTAAEPNPSPGPCPQCKGAGALRYEASPEQQKLALEMGRMLPKAGGINILNQLSGGATGGSGGSNGAGSLEKLQAMTDRLLYGDDAPIEAEVVDPEPQAPV